MKESSGAHLVAELGAKDDRERPERNEEGRPGGEPAVCVGADTTAREDDVRMRMVRHLPAPGVEQGVEAGASRTEEPRVARELLERAAGGAQERSTGGMLMGTDETAELLG